MISQSYVGISHLINSRSDTKIRQTQQLDSSRKQQTKPTAQLNKSPIKIATKSVTDFNKELEREIEASLLAVKKRTTTFKNKLEQLHKQESTQENVSNDSDLLRESVLKEAQKQYQTNSHCIFPFGKETDIDVLKSLTIGLYNVFLRFESRESMFQSFRILNEEPLRLALQDKVVLEKRLEDRNKAITESESVVEMLKKRLDGHESRIRQISQGVQKNIQIQDQADQLSMNLRLKDFFIEDLKQVRKIEVDDLTQMNANLREKNSLLLQERIVVDSTLKALRKTNSDLNNALNRANLEITQLTQKILELDSTNQSFLQKGLTILSSFKNAQLHDDSKYEEYQNQLDQISYFGSKSNPLEHQHSNSEDSEQKQDDRDHFKREFIRLCEFNLNMIALIEKNPDMSQLYFKSELVSKKQELQGKYMLATTAASTAKSQEIRKPSNNIFY